MTHQYSVRGLPSGGRALPGLPVFGSTSTRVSHLNPIVSEGYPAHPLPVVGQWDCADDEVVQTAVGACVVPAHAPFTRVDFTYSQQVKGGTMPIDHHRFLATAYCDGGAVPGYYLGLFVLEGTQLRIVDWSMFTESASVQRVAGFTRTAHDNVFVVNISCGRVPWSPGQYASIGTVVVVGHSFSYEEKISSVTLLGAHATNYYYSAYVAAAARGRYFYATMLKYYSSGASQSQLFVFTVDETGDLQFTSNIYSSTNEMLYPGFVDEYSGRCAMMQWPYNNSGSTGLGVGTAWPTARRSDGVPTTISYTGSTALGGCGRELSDWGNPFHSVVCGDATGRVDFASAMTFPFATGVGVLPYYPRPLYADPGRTLEQSTCNFYVAGNGSLYSGDKAFTFSANQSYRCAYTTTNMAECGGEGVVCHAYYTTNQSCAIIYLPDWRGGRSIIRTISFNNNVSARRMVFLGDRMLALTGSSATENRMLSVGQF